MRLPGPEECHQVALQDPKEAAFAALNKDNVPVEERKTGDIVEDLVELSRSLQPRWNLFCSYKTWKETDRRGREPMFWDQARGVNRSAQFALAPCQLVNKTLNSAVGLTLREYSAEKLQSVLAAVSTSVEARMHISLLRRIAMHAEEAMEQDALHLIFSIVEDYPEQLGDMVRDTATCLTHRPTHGDLLRALVVEVPRSLKRQCPIAYPGLPFQYFLNYSELVKAELQLLTIPAILQNSAAPYYNQSMVGLLNANPILRESLNLSPDSPEVRRFVSSFPELFGHRYLDELTFTFVGAGFPLTGIILHIETGASINLVDYDKGAVRTAKQFISITEKMGITRPGAIKVFLADATDVIYLPASQLAGGLKRYDGPAWPLPTAHCSMSPDMSGRLIVPTDILDLASALSAEVTTQVIKVNAALVPTIRKRNVRGISEVLYERFTLSEDSTFRLAGEVTPPQKVISGATPPNLVTGLTSTRNINSCQLYTNTCNFGSKMEFLESMLNLPVYKELRENVAVKESLEMWDSRVRQFYRKKWSYN